MPAGLKEDCAALQMHLIVIYAIIGYSLPIHKTHHQFNYNKFKTHRQLGIAFNEFIVLF